MTPARLSPAFELKRAVVDDAGVFSGWGAAFGNVDSYGDVIAPGAFARTLAEHKQRGTRPALLWSHYLGEPIGVWLELREDAKGLFVRGKLTLETQRGAEARALMQDGALGLSIGFRARDFAYGTKPGEPRRTLKDIELVEISAVALPANTAARITQVKSATDIRDPRAFEAFLCDAGFPRAFARGVTARGFKAAASRRDDDRDADLARLIRATATSIRNIKG